MSELLRRIPDETVKIETVLAGDVWPVSADSGQLAARLSLSTSLFQAGSAPEICLIKRRRSANPEAS
jgi:hypothetical protein